MKTPQQRRTWLTGAVAGAAALAGLAGGWWVRKGAGPQPTDELWPLRLARPGGGELVLADFRGQRLVVNFWATWCPPCVKELPDLQAFARAQGPRGWRVLALAIDSPEAVSEFLKRLPLNLDIGIAGFEGTQLARTLGNPAGSLPFTVLVGPEGEVVRRHLGQTTLAELNAWVKLADS